MNLPSPQFEQFWRAYPKKVAKRDAEKAWRKIPLADLHADEIVAGVEMWKLTRQWQDKQYIPYPATWLRRRQWEDEVEIDDGNTKSRTPAQDRSRNNAIAFNRVFGHLEGVAGGNGRALPGGNERAIAGAVRRGVAGTQPGNAAPRLLPGSKGVPIHADSSGHSSLRGSATRRPDESETE